MHIALCMVIFTLAFSIGHAILDNGLHSLLTADGKRPGRCTYHRVFRLPGVDCSRKDLQQIPATLDSDTEVIKIRLYTYCCLSIYYDEVFLLKVRGFKILINILYCRDLISCMDSELLFCS